MVSKVERILILCKTYPSPSAGHAETSCVAGITESGEMRRLYPVPFRLITDERQFKKWQWITARVEKATNDHRPESHKLFVDTIVCDGKPLPTTDQWVLHRPWIAKLPTFDDFGNAEQARLSCGITLATVRPAQILGLDIKKVIRLSRCLVKIRNYCSRSEMKYRRSPGFHHRASDIGPMAGLEIRLIADEA